MLVCVGMEQNSAIRKLYLQGGYSTVHVILEPDMFNKESLILSFYFNLGKMTLTRKKRLLYFLFSFILISTNTKAWRE